MNSLRSQNLQGVLHKNESMARHTSWRVGGLVKQFYIPADVDDLAGFLCQLSANEPIIWLGLGSNLLVRDGGINGTVISTSGLLNGLECSDDAEVRAEAGVPCAKVARFCGQRNLVGAEFFAGIPGTVGGALAMNAGAFGGETWQWVTSVETISRDGVRRQRRPGEYTISYRSVSGPADEWFVAAHFKLPNGDGPASLARIKALLEKRNQTQPTGCPTCGSVFRNPPGQFAGQLIEQCGLKGFSIGGASIAEKHANFIVNTGDASAAEIEALIKYVMTEVEKQCGVSLVPEVRIVGEDLL